MPFYRRPFDKGNLYIKFEIEFPPSNFIPEDKIEVGDSTLYLECGFVFKFILTNRFHVAVCLFSNRSRMTSKCGKNKKVAHKAPYH